MSARDRILSRLHAGYGGQALPQPDIAAHYIRFGRQETAEARLSRFKQAIEAAHAEVFLTGPGEWPDLLWTIAARKGLRRLLVGENLPHVSRLRSAAMDPLSLVEYRASVDQWRSAMFDEVDASLTLARSAIAETGSLILWPDANEPRLMSLVPPVHFVLLDPAHLHADLHAAMKAEGWAKGLPTNALLISGPSKTADIQQVLAYGAHGPKELIVLICPGLEDAA